MRDEKNREKKFEALLKQNERIDRLSEKMKILESYYKKIKVRRLQYFILGIIVGMFLAGCIEYLLRQYL